MPDRPPERSLSLEEFWARLAQRDVEPDLAAALRERTTRERGEVTRVGHPATVEAVAGRILPGAVPVRALAVFLDARFDQQLGRADEDARGLTREVLTPAGFAALDAAAGDGAGAFAALEAAAQDALLARAERGELEAPPGLAEPARFNSSEWFRRVRDLLLLAYGSDPRGMVQMGFPGPSYKPGNVWLDQMEVERRAARAPGFLRY